VAGFVLAGGGGAGGGRAAPPPPHDLAQVVEGEPQGKAQTRKAQLLKSTLCSDFMCQICYDTDFLRISTHITDVGSRVCADSG